MENTKLLEQIIAYLVKNVVTKDDLVRFATKDDLRETKKDIINELTTKLTTVITDEIDGLAASTAKGFAASATKDDLLDSEARLSQKINGTNNRVEKVEDDVRNIKTVLKMA